MADRMPEAAEATTADMARAGIVTAGDRGLPIPRRCCTGNPVPMNDDADKLMAIRAAIAREERELANLDAERARLREHLEGLKTRLDEVGNADRTARTSVTDVPTEAAPITPREKLGLFRSLFRGRADVFPLKFLSRKTGKAGYAPECANKFVPGVCGLPRIKCAECRNQAL